jgi:hypothetical protein
MRASGAIRERYFGHANALPQRARAAFHRNFRLSPQSGPDWHLTPAMAWLWHAIAMSAKISMAMTKSRSSNLMGVH